MKFKQDIPGDGKHPQLTQEGNLGSKIFHAHMRTMVLVYLQNWVILFGQMLGFIFHHHGSHMAYGMNVFHGL
jgi:hypothetical protein